MNQVIIKGNLCKDNEVRYTQNGKPLTSGLIAHSPWHPKDQQPTKEEKDKETIFVGFEGWGNYPAKTGDQCTLIGELVQYESKKYGCKMLKVHYKEIFIKAKESANSTTILDEVKKRQQQDEDTPVFDDDIPFK